MNHQKRTKRPGGSMLPCDEGPATMLRLPLDAWIRVASSFPHVVHVHHSHRSNKPYRAGSDKEELNEKATHASSLQLQTYSDVTPASRSRDASSSAATPSTTMAEAAPLSCSLVEASRPLLCLAMTSRIIRRHLSWPFPHLLTHKASLQQHVQEARRPTSLLNGKALSLDDAVSVGRDGEGLCMEALAKAAHSSVATAARTAAAAAEPAAILDDDELPAGFSACEWAWRQSESMSFVGPSSYEFFRAVLLPASREAASSPHVNASLRVLRLEDVHDDDASASTRTRSSVLLQREPIIATFLRCLASASLQLCALLDLELQHCTISRRTAEERPLDALRLLPRLHTLHVRNVCGLRDEDVESIAECRALVQLTLWSATVTSVAGLTIASPPPHCAVVSPSQLEEVDLDCPLVSDIAGLWTVPTLRRLTLAHMTRLVAPHDVPIHVNHATMPQSTMPQSSCDACHVVSLLCLNSSDVAASTSLASQQASSASTGGQALLRVCAASAPCGCASLQHACLPPSLLTHLTLVGMGSLSSLVNIFVACPDLQGLVVSHCRHIKDESFEGIGRLCAIENLSLQHCGVQRLLPIFRECHRSLESLTCQYCPLDPRGGLEGLEWCSALQCLDVRCTNIEALPKFWFRGLDGVDILQVTMGGSHAELPPRLRSLRLPSSVCAPAVDTVRLPPHQDGHQRASSSALLIAETLEELTFDALPLTTRWLRSHNGGDVIEHFLLPHCCSLRLLQLSTANDHLLACLCDRLPELRVLNLSGSVELTTVSTLGHTHAQSYLTHVDLRHCTSLTNDGVSGLAEVQTLTHVILSHCVSVTNLSCLSRCRSLQELDASETGITLDGIVDVALAPTLEYLHVFGFASSHIQHTQSPTTQRLLQHLRQSSDSEREELEAQLVVRLAVNRCQAFFEMAALTIGDHNNQGTSTRGVVYVHDAVTIGGKCEGDMSDVSDSNDVNDDEGPQMQPSDTHSLSAAARTYLSLRPKLHVLGLRNVPWTNVRRQQIVT